MNNDTENKKAKRTKKCVIKRELTFKNYTDCLSNDKPIPKSQQRFKSDWHNVYTEQINKIALSSNGDKRLQTFDKITTYPNGTNAFKVCESEMLSKIKNISFSDYANENKAQHNLNWPYIPAHPFRILIVGGSGSRKTNALFNLINRQPDTDRIYLYAKVLYEAKYQFLIDKRESTGLNYFNDAKPFIEDSNDMRAVFKNIDE